MEKSPSKVFEFLYELMEKATPYDEKEIDYLSLYGKADGIEDSKGFLKNRFCNERRK